MCMCGTSSPVFFFYCSTALARCLIFAFDTAPVTAQTRTKQMSSAPTTAAPVCSDQRHAAKNPTMKHTIEMTAESTTVSLKLFVIRIAVRGGKIMRAEIMIEPIIFIPTTIVMPVRI